MWLNTKRAVKEFTSYCGAAFIVYLVVVLVFLKIILIGVDSNYMDRALISVIMAAAYFIFVFLRIFLKVISENDQVGDRRK
ncbi:hypothetical protein DYI23_01080 [Roseibium polysiphoniae]|uniref:Uncharacterized protein n=1 Tax=Roseibium polysiphoniae TaxID=2571221 RepID=A0A944CAP5_9HYPH|nr:hypothetical protein [Roseibium polysiphoniae]